MLDEGADLEELCVRLVDMFEVDRRVCSADIDHFSSELVAAGIAEYA